MFSGGRAGLHPLVVQRQKTNSRARAELGVDPSTLYPLPPDAIEAA
jgi:hypothetical protein